MRRVAVLASLIAGLAMVCQPANADEFFLFARHPKVDQRVANTSLGVGLASTGVYLGIKEGNGVDWGAWGVTTLGCMVLSPMIAAAFTPERELTSREVMVMQGSCLIPIVGGLLVNALYDANPQWEAQQVRVVHKRARR